MIVLLNVNFQLLSTSYLILLARATSFVYQFWLSSFGSVDRDTLTVPARRKLPTSGNGYACTCILSVLLVNLTALLKASWSIRLIIMGRREQRERERKRAAASCCSLDNFLPGPSKKKTCTAAITSPVIKPVQVSII